MGAQGVGYQSVAVDSLVNPPLLEEGGQVFCFDSLHMHIGNIPDTDAPRVCTFPFRNISGRRYGLRKLALRAGVRQRHSVRKLLSGNGKYGDVGI